MRLVSAALAILLIAMGSDVFAQERSLTFPVTIHETDEQAAHSKSREETADRHEAADLEAQQRAATAAERSASVAERQETPAWVQIAIGGAGVVIAIIALVVSVVTLLQSSAAARAQTRAYLTVKAIDLEDIANKACHPGKHLHIHVKWENKGNSPALNCDIFTVPVLLTSEEVDKPIKEIEGRRKAFKTGSIVLSAGRELQARDAGLDNAEYALWLGKERELAIYCAAKYKDVFGKMILVEDCVIVVLNEGVTNFRSCRVHNGLSIA